MTAPELEPGAASGRSQHDAAHFVDAAVTRSRFFTATSLLFFPLIMGVVVSEAAISGGRALLVAGATPFVIVELVDKLIEFLLQGRDGEDWFQGVFQQVRVPAALMSGSFVAGTLAGEHVMASVVGLCVFVGVVATVRALRSRMLGRSNSPA